MCVRVSRLVEEVRDVSGVTVANDEVFMNRTLEEFVKLVVLKGRGGGVADRTVEYDKVSGCSGIAVARAVLCCNWFRVEHGVYVVVCCVVRCKYEPIIWTSCFHGNCLLMVNLWSLLVETPCQQSTRQPKRLVCHTVTYSVPQACKW